MPRFVEAQYPVQHAGVVRLERAAHFLHRQLVRGRAALSEWAEARRRAREDAVLWNAALQDPRLMADLLRPGGTEQISR